MWVLCQWWPCIASVSHWRTHTHMNLHIVSVLCHHPLVGIQAGSPTHSVGESDSEDTALVLLWYCARKWKSAPKLYLLKGFPSLHKKKLSCESEFIGYFTLNLNFHMKMAKIRYMKVFEKVISYESRLGRQQVMAQGSCRPFLREKGSDVLASQDCHYHTTYSTMMVVTMMMTMMVTTTMTMMVTMMATTMMIMMVTMMVTMRLYLIMCIISDCYLQKA